MKLYYFHIFIDQFQSSEFSIVVWKFWVHKDMDINWFE